MKWLADENFRNAIVRGIPRQSPAFDIVRAQDIPHISGQDDRTMPGCAVSEGRVEEQLRVASRCAPIVLVPDSLPTGLAIEEILLLDECALEADWAAGVAYLPLR